MLICRNLIDRGMIQRRWRVLSTLGSVDARAGLMPHDNRGATVNMWKDVVDKVANVFGKSDAYIDQYDSYYNKFQKEPADGVQSLPNEHSWCEALALAHSNQLVVADLQNCLEKGEQFRTDAKKAFAAVTKELTDLRDYSSEISKAYKKCVNDHCIAYF